MLLHVHGDASLVYVLEVCGFEGASPEISLSVLNVSDLAIYNIFIVSGNHKHICNIKCVLFFKINSQTVLPELSEEISI